MKYSRCFNDDTRVSEITFGCGPLSGVDWGSFDVKETMLAVETAHELGVNVFDTADVYGLGTSEKLLSEALGSKRHDVIISTKFGVNWSKANDSNWAETFYDASPKRVIEALEGSLRRLRLDSIPLYYIHWPDPKTPFEETALALKRCQEDGKVQRIGLSNFPLDSIKKFSQYLNVSAVQAQYSLIDREIENEFLDVCKNLDIAVFTYGPLAQGLLTGKYSSDSEFQDDDCRSRLPHFQSEEFSNYANVLNEVKQLASNYDVAMAQLALRWVLENPKIASAITGIKSESQIIESVNATRFDINECDSRFFNGRN